MTIIILSRHKLPASNQDAVYANVKKLRDTIRNYADSGCQELVNILVVIHSMVDVSGKTFGYLLQIMIKHNY